MGCCRPGAILPAILCSVMACIFSGCGRSKAAPGQPTMNELMHRRADSRRQARDYEEAALRHAQALTPVEAQQVLANLKQNPQDGESFRALIFHYQYTSDLQGLDALRLWYIAHEPGGKISPGNINPRWDRATYDRGKALWLAHVKRPGAVFEIFRRAADFLEGGDKPLAEQVLEAGRKAYPDNRRWSRAFGRHYAQVLLGSAEPLTGEGVFRLATAEEAHTPYALGVRARLEKSTDVPILAQTVQYLTVWGNPFARAARESGIDGIPLARMYLQRAVSLGCDSNVARGLASRITQIEQVRRRQQLLTMSPAEQSHLPDSDRMLLTLFQMQTAWSMQNTADAAAKARVLLDLSARNQGDPLFGDAVLESNLVLGKLALRNGEKKAAMHYLLAAADAPSDLIRRGEFEMNLPRALVDRGEREAVAQFLERIAPKTIRPLLYREWAAKIRQGINPDLVPMTAGRNCSQDPC